MKSGSRARRRVMTLESPSGRVVTCAVVADIWPCVWPSPDQDCPSPRAKKTRCLSKVRAAFTQAPAEEDAGHTTAAEQSSCCILHTQ